MVVIVETVEFFAYLAGCIVVFGGISFFKPSHDVATGGSDGIFDSKAFCQTWVVIDAAFKPAVIDIVSGSAEPYTVIPGDYHRLS